MSIDKAKKIDTVKLGKRIRQLRESEELSIQDLADKIDVSYNVVANIEIGRTEPCIPDLINICNVFDIEPDVLCFDLIEKNRNYVEHKVMENIQEIVSVAPKMAVNLQNLLESVLNE